MSNIGFYPVKSRCLRYLPAVILICFVAVAIYSNTFQSPFVFDDQPTIQENAKIRNPGNFFTPDVLRSPRPLVDFTFALNYHFGKLRVFGYHLVNLFIHIANGILVFFLSRMLFRKLSGMDDPDSFLAALFAALIFIAHPLQTQAVTYIAQRYAAMAAFFYLAAVLSYILARDVKSAQNPLTRYGFFLASFFSGVLAFLSKQNSASLPLAILLVEYVCYDQSRRGWGKKLVLILPGVALCGFVYAYNMGLFRQEIQFATLLEDVSEMARETQGISRWRYLCTQFNVISIYIRLLLIPIHQNLDYLYPFKNGFFDGATPYAFIFLSGILFAAGWIRKKIPVVFLGILWFFVTLSVESSIIPIRDALFEHRLYLPMFGFSLILGHGGNRLLAKWRPWGYVGMLLILILLSVSTFYRNAIWRDEVSLWSDVATKNPSNFRALANLGIAYQDRGEIKAALANYDAAIRLSPDYYVVLYDKGVLLGQMGRTEEAIALFNEALRIKPNYAKALVNLGVAVARKGDSGKAIAYLQQALTIQPDSFEANLNLATIFANNGKLESAADHYLRALRMEPDNAKLHSKVGVVLHVLSRYHDAADHFREAIRIEPNSAEAYLNLANSQMSLNMPDEAIQAYKETIRLNPASLEGYTNLGVVLMKTGDKEEAVKQFHAAVKIKPDSVEARINLGSALYYQGKVPEAMEQFGIALQLKPDSKEIFDKINGIILSKPVTSKEPVKSPDPGNSGESRRP